MRFEEGRYRNRSGEEPKNFRIMGYGWGMRKPNGQQAYLLDEAEQDQELDEQKVLLKAFCGILYHYFGGWQKLFLGGRDGRNRELIRYPLKSLLSAGVLMFLFRLGARRQINYQLRGSTPSQTKFVAWFEVEEVPHGDTLNYAFKKVAPAEMQEVVCRMVENLIRKKVL